MLVLDTDVMIDILRGYPDTVAWLQSLGDEKLMLPAPVVMELIKGCVGKKDVADLLKKINSIAVYFPTERDAADAIRILAQVHPSHSTGILDAIIGQCAISLNAPLATFNQKHFKGIPGIQLCLPYPKKTGFIARLVKKIKGNAT